MKRIDGWFVALAISFAATAKVAGAQVPPRLPPSVTTETPTALTVQNNRQAAVTVYLAYGQFDRRLGVVPGLDTKTLSLPEWVLNGRTVHLFVHPDGEPLDLATHTFSVKPPGRIGLIVPATGGMRSAVRDSMMEPIPEEELANATLTVENQRDKAVTVFAQQRNFDVRLGQVPAGGKATLRFPKSIVLPSGDVTIFVHPDGELDLASETLHVTPGAHLGVRVPKR